MSRGRFLVLVGENRFLEHVAAHHGQQSKGNPVGISFHVALHRGAQAPADRRHQRLKKAEMPGEAKGLAQADLLETDTGGDGHGESVHGKGHGKCEYMRVGHGFSPWFRKAAIITGSAVECNRLFPGWIFPLIPTVKYGILLRGCRWGAATEAIHSNMDSRPNDLGLRVSVPDRNNEDAMGKSGRPDSGDPADNNGFCLNSSGRSQTLFHETLLKERRKFERFFV